MWCSRFWADPFFFQLLLQSEVFLGSLVSWRTQWYRNGCQVTTILENLSVNDLKWTFTGGFMLMPVLSVQKRWQKCLWQELWHPSDYFTDQGLDGEAQLLLQSLNIPVLGGWAPQSTCFFSGFHRSAWNSDVTLCVCQQAHTGQNDLIIPDHKIGARKVYSALDFMDSAITRDKTNLVLDNRPVILSWNARKHWISWFTDWLRIFVVLKTRKFVQQFTWLTRGVLKLSSW